MSSEYRAQRRASIGLVALMVLALAPAIPGASMTVAAAPQCCDSVEFPLIFIDGGSAASFTPFESEVSGTVEAPVTQSVQGVTEVASWSLVWGHSGDFPASDWRFAIDYAVENAAGVHANATVEVEIGGRSTIAETNPGTYLSGGGSVVVTVPMEAGTVSAGEIVEVTFSVRNLLFSQPGDETAVKFTWGEGTESRIDVNFPLMSVEMKTASTNGRDVYFPVVIKSGFGERMWTAISSHAFSVANLPIGEAPLAGTIFGGVEITFHWQASDAEIDGIRNANLSMTLNDGDTPIEIGRSHDIVFTEGDGELSWYPENEPLRTSGSDLDVDISIRYDGSRVDRTVRLDMTGAMSQWMRWGMDNIGNNSLDSTSWWRNPSGASVPDSDMNNARVDSSETEALLTHIGSSSANLRRFLSDGLAIDPDGLFEADLFEMNPDVKIDLLGVDTFSDERLRIEIETSLLLTDQNRLTLIEDFARPLRTPYWSTIDLDISLTTGMLSGIFQVNGEGVDYTHRRAGLTEFVTVSETGLTDDHTFTVTYVVSETPLFSPIITLVATVLLVAVAIALGLALTRRRSRTLIGFSIPVFIAIAGYAYIQAALPPTIQLGIVASLTVMAFPIALVSPRHWDEDEVLGDGALGDDLEEASKKLREIPTVTCPACTTVNPVESRERPLRLPCGGCGRTLRIE